MIARAFKNFVRDENGMEMVEWAIVGVVFALAAATLWTTLKDDIGTALGKVGDCVADGTGCVN
jgi:Flp pilus assembly pilin Flp